MKPHYNKQSLVKFIGNVSLFQNADKAVHEHLAAKTILTAYEVNETVIHKGDVGDAMYLILKGRLKVHDNEHQVATLESGELFGELSLLDREPRSMSVTTLEPTLLGNIYRDDFFEIFQKFPGMAQDIIAVLNKRLRSQNNYLISEYKSREEKLKELVAIRTAEVMQQKKELEKKNEVIEEKNKEMMDSLTYAKRLQDAILPKQETITHSFKQSFILYLPKDIVSGDFYACENFNNKVIMAAADCTGHGVPGAIMSMIGSSLLKQIIREKNITDPAEILNQLSKGVIEALKQSENDTHDGMDMALCVFDLQNNQVFYSGANRPLWLVRNQTLEVFTPDKIPVGGLQIRSQTYTSHCITLQKGDTLYMFSDGYADQFGGMQGKKLMTKKLKELLLNLQDKPMPEQGRFLQRYFEEWKGKNFEQVDDVLMVGIRI